MKIVEVAGPSHREDGGPGYVLQTLREMCDCRRKTALEPPSDWGEWDGSLEVDWAADAFPDLPEFIPPAEKPSVIWNSDTHWSNKAYLYRLNHSKHFQHVYCAQLNDCAKFGRDGVKAEWMPHAVEHRCYTPRLRNYNMKYRHNLPPDPGAWHYLMCANLKHYDWCFIGFMNTDHRIRGLEQMCDGFENFYVNHALFFEDVAKVYTDSKVVMNISVCGDLNMRSFEVLATRSCLLTDEQNGMAEAGFKHMENCLIYHSTEEAMDLMSWALDHPVEREQIADAGWRMVLEKHTYSHRARTLLDKFEALAHTNK